MTLKERTTPDGCRRGFVVIGRAALALLATMCATQIAQTKAVAAAVVSADSASSDISSRAAIGHIGRLIFFDVSLSKSGRQSCASCHDPAHAYGPSNALSVQLGGADLNSQGMRAVPSLRYTLIHTPRWSKSFVADPIERLREGDEPPAGGFGWDGRFDTLHDQAEFPLLAASEMANASPAEVVAKLRRTAYAEQFRKVFGRSVLEDAKRAYASALAALERFELDDPSFRPYTSKYDDFLEGRARFSEQELRGLSLFNDPRRGNCATCHLDAKGADGSHPLFTDYQFETLGVPRNLELAVNVDPTFFDRGLCGPLRHDQAPMTQYCGMFKTPTLRNVADRGVFFHNGQFHSLRDALRFYVRRDTEPSLWYPTNTAGTVVKFDDLPASERNNADVVDAPLTRKLGEAPAWSDAEIDDVIAFLETLTDADVRSLEKLRPSQQHGG